MFSYLVILHERCVAKMYSNKVFLFTQNHFIKNKFDFKDQ